MRIRFLSMRFTAQQREHLQISPRSSLEAQSLVLGVSEAVLLRVNSLAQSFDGLRMSRKPLVHAAGCLKQPYLSINASLITPLLLACLVAIILISSLYIIGLCQWSSYRNAQ